ncbi:sensor histidine kinase [Sphingomonas lutea]|nr:HWE histidine kinase domain-containing protein [Sphingomonas lutea]
MAEARSVDELVAVLRGHARRLIGADGIAIILRDGECCHYVEEDAIGPLWKGGRFPLESCVSGWAMVNRRTAVIADILADSRVPHEAYRGTFVRSMAMAPMGGPDPRGALGAYWAQAHVACEAEVNILERLADVAGEALNRLAGGVAPPKARPLRFAARRRLRLPHMDAQTLLLALLPRRTLPFWKGQLLAVGLAAVSGVLRHAGTPLIGTTSVYTAFFPAILIAALWAGPRAAATAILVSTIAGAWISFSIEGSGVGWLMFPLIAAVVAIVACSVRAALDVQHFRSGALENRDRELASISRELDHRSKNTLAVVSALTRQAAEASENKEEMRDRLCGHFAAMGAAQTLLLEVGSKNVAVKRLVEEALAPFIQEGQISVEVDPELEAPTGCEVMLSLAVNELATNSCKYGALSAPSGNVRVTGSHTDLQANLVWSEFGGPRVETPGPASTGSRLINRALTGAPGGRVDVSFHPAGLRCEFAGWPVSGWRRGKARLRLPFRRRRSIASDNRR